MAKVKLDVSTVLEDTQSGGRTLEKTDGIQCKEILKLITQLESDRSRKMGAILEQLKILHENQEALKEQTGLTFKEVIEQYAHMSKSNFYSILKSYDFLSQYGKTDLLDSIDKKLIEYISTRPEIEQKPLLEKAVNREFSRKDIPKSPAERAHVAPHGAQTAKGDTLPAAAKGDKKRQFKSLSNSLIDFLNSCTRAEQKAFLKELESEIISAYK